MDITITIKKSSVYEEVAKTTAYAGARDEEVKYDRVFTTEDDRLMLERFWREACTFSTDIMKKFISTVTTPVNSQTVDLTDDYEAVLSMPSAFDSNLTGSIQESLFSYFVNSISAKWFKITNRKDAEIYTADATSFLNKVKTDIFFRKNPTRVVPG
jgi:hypothetical protein